MKIWEDYSSAAMELLIERWLHRKHLPQGHMNQVHLKSICMRIVMWGPRSPREARKPDSPSVVGHLWGDVKLKSSWCHLATHVKTDYKVLDFASFFPAKIATNVVEVLGSSLCHTEYSPWYQWHCGLFGDHKDKTLQQTSCLQVLWQWWWADPMEPSADQCLEPSMLPVHPLPQFPSQKPMLQQLQLKGNNLWVQKAKYNFVPKRNKLGCFQRVSKESQY